jgi:5-methylcytosine-specific restriction endonuclease McrA
MTKEEIEYVINVLRRGTTTWVGRTQCLNRSRYLAVNPKTDRTVYWRDCDQCGRKTMLAEGLLEVDHIVRIGGFQGSWDKIVNDMYCGQDNLQALCAACHTKKSAVENAKHRLVRKSKLS